MKDAIAKMKLVPVKNNPGLYYDKPKTNGGDSKLYGRLVKVGIDACGNICKVMVNTNRGVDKATFDASYKDEAMNQWVKGGGVWWEDFKSDDERDALIAHRRAEYQKIAIKKDESDFMKASAMFADAVKSLKGEAKDVKTKSEKTEGAAK